MTRRAAGRCALLALAAAGLWSPTSSAAAQESPELAPLAPRTAQSGLPLDPVRAAMALPALALSFTVDPASRTVAGAAHYIVRATAPLDRLAFDLDPRYAIAGIAVDGVALAPGDWANPDGLLTLALPRSLAAGEEARVTIRWSGAPHVARNPPWDGGITWSHTPERAGGAGKAPWIATAIQGEGCDLLWPCLDHPAKRVGLLDLAIRVPEPLVAAANGRLVAEEHADGWATWRWRARNPNNYGVTIQIAPYELAQDSYASRYGNSIPLAFWHLPGEAAGATRLLGELKDYLAFFEQAVGPYPFADEKAGIAQTPHLGMEHQTINAYGNRFRLAPEGYDWLLQHEFAHEWFANQMTHRTQGEMWLHEGLGTYMQPLYLRWKGGDLPYHAALWDQRKRILARVPLVSPDPEAIGDYLDKASGWGNDIYYKGSWIAHTLRETIGDAAFAASLRRLVYGRDDPAPGNFAPVLRDSAEFEAIVEQVTGREMGWFFDTYLRTAALPRLDVERDGASLALAWHSDAATPFAMPVEVRIGDRLLVAAMEGGRGTLDLGDASAPFVLDPEGKILRHDPAIAAWQAQEEAAREAAPPDG